MKIKYWIWVTKAVTLVLAGYGLITWLMYGKIIREIPWLPLFFILWATQDVLEAIDSHDNWIWHRNMAFAALLVFMAGISWWVQIK